MSDDLLLCDKLRAIYPEHKNVNQWDVRYEAAERILSHRAEITRLRAELAAVIAERDRMWEVIKSINGMLEIFCETLERPTYNSLEVGQRHNPLSQKEIIQRLTETCSFVRADLLKTIDEARAALEGVTEPASPWRDIESAPKDKSVLVLGKMRDGNDYQEVSKYFHIKNCWPVIFMDGCLAPTHWMPLPEPPK